MNLSYQGRQPPLLLWTKPQVEVVVDEDGGRDLGSGMRSSRRWVHGGGGIDEDETPGGGGVKRSRRRSWQWTVSISTMGLLQKCVGY